MTYNIPPYADYPAFNIKACAVRRYSNTKIITVELSVDVRYSGPRDETNMAVINVKLLSGFKLDEESLRPMSDTLRADVVFDLPSLISLLVLHAHLCPVPTAEQ
ncbi:hypothetical protein MHYP_G00196090 [Metynnis hypsauchen]